MTGDPSDIAGRLREVKCRYCSRTQRTLLHDDKKGRGLSFVCIECGRRNHIHQGPSGERDSSPTDTEPS